MVDESKGLGKRKLRLGFCNDHGRLNLGEPSKIIIEKYSTVESGQIGENLFSLYGHCTTVFLCRRKIDCLEFSWGTNIFCH